MHLSALLQFAFSTELLYQGVLIYFQGIKLHIVKYSPNMLALC